MFLLHGLIHSCNNVLFYCFAVKLRYTEHYNVLCEASKDARNSWHNLGIALGMSPVTLTGIETKCRDDTDAAFKDMLGKWMQSGQNCTLDVFLKALKSDGVMCGWLCEEVEEKMRKAIINRKRSLNDTGWFFNLYFLYTH